MWAERWPPRGDLHTVDPVTLGSIGARMFSNSRPWDPPTKPIFPIRPVERESVCMYILWTSHIGQCPAFQRVTLVDLESWSLVVHQAWTLNCCWLGVVVVVATLPTFCQSSDSEIGLIDRIGALNFCFYSKRCGDVCNVPICWAIGWDCRGVYRK